MPEKIITDGEFSGSIGMTVGMAFAEKDFSPDLISLADKDLSLRKQAKKVGR